MKIVYKCGENQLIWNGHSNHKTPLLQTIPIPVKYQKLISEKIWLLESASCILESILCATLVIVVPKKADPLCPNKKQLHVVLDYQLLDKYINGTHNGNKVILCYILPNITDVLARLHICKIFSSLDLKTGCHQIGLMPKGKLKTAFATTSRKWHWNATPFGIYSLTGGFCYLMSQVLTGLDVCFLYLGDISIYRPSWKEHLQHLETVFSYLKTANLKIELSKCQFFKWHLHYLVNLGERHSATTR